MIEAEPKMRVQEIETSFRVLLVGEQRVPNLNLGDAGGVSVAFDPRLEVGECRVVAPVLRAWRAW